MTAQQSPPVRRPAGRSEATREAVLDAAERLFSEHGISAVSNRQIGEAAGQGNTAVVGYHFGSKAELVRALVRRRNDAVERLREARLARLGDSTDVRDWVGCIVLPVTEHLGSLPPPTWYARFGAQVQTDPHLSEVMAREALATPSLRHALRMLDRCLPALAPEIRRERADIGRIVMVHMCADRERALAEGTPTPRATWADAGAGLVDALVAIWLAPAGPSPGPGVGQPG